MASAARLVRLDEFADEAASEASRVTQAEHQAQRRDGQARRPSAADVVGKNAIPAALGQIAFRRLSCFVRSALLPEGRNGRVTTTRPSANLTELFRGQYLCASRPSRQAATTQLAGRHVSRRQACPSRRLSRFQT
jgi:hypothetical protein